jgi:hypothetical protein
MSENSNGNVKEAMPNTEVVAKAKRKRFTAAEKLRILREVDACQGSGEVGALLRREGSIFPIDDLASNGNVENWRTGTSEARTETDPQAIDRACCDARMNACRSVCDRPN